MSHNTGTHIPNTTDGTAFTLVAALVPATVVRQWAAVDRGHDAGFPIRYRAQGYPHGHFFFAAVVITLTLCLGVAVLAVLPDPTLLTLPPA